MSTTEYFPTISMPKSLFEKLKTLPEYLSGDDNRFHFKSHTVSGHRFGVSDDIQNMLKNPDNVLIYSSDFHEMKDILHYRRDLLKFLKEKELPSDDLIFTIRIQYPSATWLTTIRHTRVEFDMLQTVITVETDYKILSICSEHDDFRMFQSRRNNGILEFKSNPDFNKTRPCDDNITNSTAFFIGDAAVVSDLVEVVDHFVFIQTGEINENEIVFASYLINFE